MSTGSGKKKEEGNDFYRPATLYYGKLLGHDQVQVLSPSSPSLPLSLFLYLSLSLSLSLLDNNLIVVDLLGAGKMTKRGGSRFSQPGNRVFLPGPVCK